MLRIALAGIDKILDIIPEVNKDVHFIEYVNDEKNHVQDIAQQINSGLYEKHLPKGKDLVIFDIGANIGLVTLHLAPVAKRIIAVEPWNDHFDYIAGLARKKAVIERYKGALAEHVGTIDFFLNPDNSTMNSLVKTNQAAQTVKVECVNLAGLLRRFNLEKVDFCKVDIEGSEMTALSEEQIQAAAGVIKKYFVEVHPTEFDINVNRMDLVGRFTRCGYDVEVVDYQTLVATKK